MAETQDCFKYGAFEIDGEVAVWNGDDSVKIRLAGTAKDAGVREGFWNPLHHPLQERYAKAVTGICIWGKYDFLIFFKPNGRGNQGAVRSFASPKDRLDVIERLSRGQKAERIVIAQDPFGSYQLRLIDWQRDVAERFGIQKIYYSLPVEEYYLSLQALECFFGAAVIGKIRGIIEGQGDRLAERIVGSIGAEIEFVHPLRTVPSLTAEQSYVWPYQNLAFDIGIEELEEVTIPYEVLKSGRGIPPVLLGMLGKPCPYYLPRDCRREANVIGLGC